jgi:apolipoprotein N-acyltransferase
VTTVAGYAPFSIWPLPIVTLALLYALVAAAPSAGAAALRGFLFGFGLFGAGVSWVYISMHVYGMMPMPLAAFATAGFCAFLALFPALACALVRALPAAPPSLAWIGGAASIWTLVEWLRGWVLTGFPWLGVGYSQATDSPLAGYAPLGGVYAVTLALALTAAALTAIAAPRRARGAARAPGRWSLVGLVAVVSLAGSAARAIEWTTPVGAPVTVALLQGNVPQDLKWRPERVAPTLELYQRMIEAADAQLIVLPETAIPMFAHEVPPQWLQAIVAHAKTEGSDVLIGLPERDEARREYYNSVFSVGASPVQVYRKVHLVPFGEYMPARPLFGWIVDTMQIPLQDFTPGSIDQRPLAIAGQRVAVNICYEDVFGEGIIRQLPEATLLVNASNTAWFGRSLAQPQHLQIAQLRALETGRPMLRATNTGMTAIIDARGRVSAVVEPFTETTLRGEVRGYTGATPYVRTGNAPAVALAFALLAVAVYAARRYRLAG